MMQSFNKIVSGSMPRRGYVRNIDKHRSSQNVQFLA